MSIRKLTAFLLCCVLAVTLLPLSVFAEVSDTDVSDTQPNDEVSDEVSTEVECTVTVDCQKGGEYEVTGCYDDWVSHNEYYFHAGDTAEVTVVCKPGMAVDTFTVDGAEIAPANGKYSFVVSDNHAVSITFKAVPMGTVVVQCIDNEGADVTGISVKVNGTAASIGEISLPKNEKYTIDFAPLVGYEIVSTELFIGNTYIPVDAPYTMTLTDNVGYRVVVKAIEGYSAQFTVGENGKVQVNGVDVETEFVLPKDKNSTITFVPDEGFAVDTVKINGEEVEVKNNAYTFTPEGEVTVEVTFTEKKENCKITLAIGANGTISVKDDEYEIEGKYIYVPVGESITLVIEPHVNFEVNQFKVNGKNQKLTEENEFVLECTESAAAVSVTFKSTENPEDNKYTITAFASGGGNITPAGATEVKEGENLVFEITADEGYEVFSVTVDGEKVELTDGKYTFKNISANAVINATFRKKQVADVAVGVEDIDWTAEQLVIDVSKKSNVSTEVFARAKETYPGKAITITDSEFSILIPANSGFVPEGETVSFEFMRNASPDFVAIQNAVSAEYIGMSFVTVYATVPALPAGTNVELFLGSEFAGADMDMFFFASGGLTAVDGKVTADQKGWATVPYSNQKDLVFVESAEVEKPTLTITYNTEMGTVDPAATVKTEPGEIKTITVTAKEGYKIAKVMLDGTEITLDENGTCKVTMNSDHTFTVVFEEIKSANVGLIIALVIIAIAVVAGATFFVLRWRKNQF